MARLGAHRVIVHGFAKELSFDPPPNGVVPSPHWVDEDLPLEDIVEAACPYEDTSGDTSEDNASGSPYRAAVMITCRHVDPARLASPEWGVLERVGRFAGRSSVGTGRGYGAGVDVVGLWLPGGKAPPRNVVQWLEEHSGLLVSYNIDSDEGGGSPLAPFPYVGMTDFLDRATAVRDV